MLRLIGLVVVVLLLVSVSHGERRSGGEARSGSTLEVVADQVSGLLAAGVERLDDLLLGAPDGPRAAPDLAGLSRHLEAWSRSADAASRRTLSGAVLRACPSLNLICQPADEAPDGDGMARRPNGHGDLRGTPPGP